MHIKAQFELSEKPFDSARADFEDLVGLLESSATGNMTHSQVESLISARGTELMRQLFQGYLNSGGLGEAEGDVITEDGNVQTHVRVRKRRLMSKFGPVEVTRTGYGSREQSPVYPRDGGVLSAKLHESRAAGVVISGVREIAPEVYHGNRRNKHFFREDRKALAKAGVVA